MSTSYPEFSTGMTEEGTLSPELWEPIPAVEQQGEHISRPSLTYLQDAWRRFRRNPTALIGLVLLALIFAFAIFGPILSSHSYREQNLNGPMNLRAPSTGSARTLTAGTSSSGS
jgi:oligopeptide transport system permease protein